MSRHLFNPNLFQSKVGRRSSHMHLEATFLVAVAELVAALAAGLVVAPIGLLIRNLAAPSLQSWPPSVQAGISTRACCSSRAW